MRVIPHAGTFDSALDGRFIARQEALAILKVVSAAAPKGLTKTAGANADVTLAVLKAVLAGLEKLDISTSLSDPKDILAKSAATTKTSSRDASVKIASKEIKDSHYNIDVTKDAVEHQGRKLIMVAFLMTDAYLGRYIIKRNYYYLPSNEAEAEDTFDELTRKAQKVKSRYLSGQIKTTGIKPEVKAFLDGVKGDFESSGEDDLGTTAKRDKTTGHETAGPTYIRQA